MEDLSTSNFHYEYGDYPVAGVNSILPKEHGNKFYILPVIKNFEKDVCAVAAWDSSVHDCVHLNKVTDSKYKVDFFFNSLFFIPILLFSIIVYNLFSEFNNLSKISLNGMKVVNNYFYEKKNIKIRFFFLFIFQHIQLMLIKLYFITYRVYLIDFFY